MEYVTSCFSREAGIPWRAWVYQGFVLSAFVEMTRAVGPLVVGLPSKDVSAHFARSVIEMATDNHAREKRELYAEPAG